jgi:phage replication-related protein YjqB (UPF0714/DUF867 family)
MMITASQAREKTDISTAKIERVLELISQEIDSAAMSGQNHIYIDTALALHGYISKFTSKIHVADLAGGHKIICKKLRENGYSVRMVNHNHDIEYFRKIYDRFDEEDSPNRFSIMVSW